MCKLEPQESQAGALDSPAGTLGVAWVFEGSGQLLLPLPIENTQFLSWCASRRPETFLSNGPCVSTLLLCSPTGQVRSDGLQDGQVSLTRSGQQADL